MNQPGRHDEPHQPQRRGDDPQTPLAAPEEEVEAQHGNQRRDFLLGRQRQHNCDQERAPLALLQEVTGEQQQAGRQRHRVKIGEDRAVERRRQQIGAREDQTGKCAVQPPLCEPVRGQRAQAHRQRLEHQQSCWVAPDEKEQRKGDQQQLDVVAQQVVGASELAQRQVDPGILVGRELHDPAVERVPGGLGHVAQVQRAGAEHRVAHHGRPGEERNPEGGQQADQEFSG